MEAQEEQETTTLEHRGQAVIFKGERTNYPENEIVPYFFFHLESPNHKILTWSQLYTQKHNVTEVLERYFPEFEVVDST